jgi:hypothetical protein
VSSGQVAKDAVTEVLVHPAAEEVVSDSLASFSTFTVRVGDSWNFSVKEKVVEADLSSL